MNLTAQDNRCWICGCEHSQENKLTMHHCIPQNFNPVNNVVVPVCSECHDKLNEADIASLYQFAAKIERGIATLSKQTSILTRYIESNHKIKIKK